MKHIKTLEFEYNSDKKYYKIFKIDGKDYGTGIAEIDIHIEALEPLKIKIYGNKEHMANTELLEYYEVEFYQKID